MSLGFGEIADSIRSFSLKEKAYLAKMLLADIETGVTANLPFDSMPTFEQAIDDDR